MQYVVFDIETTGLHVSKDRIVEIGAVKLKDDEIIDTFSLLINPGVLIPREVSEINHITNEMIAYALPSQVALHQFQKFIDGSDFLVGHNAAKFDYPFLLAEFERHGVHHQTMRVRDTVFIARKNLPYMKRYSLASLCQHFQIVNEDAHRALSDAIATAHIYLALQKENTRR